jgi:NAD(P)H dehydrogenase (quinone)
MNGRNMPEGLIGHMLAIARGGAEGAFTAEHTTPDREVVGRAPITTRQFVQDHKGVFK